MRDSRDWRFPTNPHSRHPAAEVTRRSVQEERIARDLDRWRTRRRVRPTKPRLRRSATAAIFKSFVLLLALAAFLVLGFVWVLNRAYTDRIYPNVVAGDVPVGSLTREEATNKLNDELGPFVNSPVILRFGDSTWQPSAADLGLSVDVDATVDRAMAAGRRHDLVEAFVGSLTGRAKPVTVPLVMTIQREDLDQYLSQIGQEINRDPVTPILGVSNGQVTVEGGGPGYTFLQPETATRVIRAIRTLRRPTVQVVVYTTQGEVSQAEIESARRRAQTIVSAPISLEASGRKWQITRQQLQSWLQTGVAQGSGGKAHIDVSLRPDRLRDYLEGLAKQIDHPAQNARLEWNDGNVEVLEDSQAGAKLDVDQAEQMIQRAATSEQRVVQLPVRTLEPQIASQDAGSLGIDTDLGYGESGFRGSPPERTNNIQKAAAAINGYVVPPEGTFSFKQVVGKVGTDTGYQPELVGDGQVGFQWPGSGLSQVSTTLFRAVMRSGLPVLERHASPYRIGYYEQDGQPMGTDAVVGEDADFEFANSTDHPVLIQVSVGADQVRVDLYGADQGWQVSVGRPTITNVTQPAGGPAYWHDPMLKTGQTQLYVPRASGAQVSVDRKVTKNGELINEDHFNSEYAPTAGIYAQGAGT